jgi:hypothetical protein
LRCFTWGVIGRMWPSSCSYFCGVQTFDRWSTSWDWECASP